MPKQCQTFISHNGLQSNEYVFSWVGVAGDTYTLNLGSSEISREYGVNSTLNGEYLPYEISSGGSWSWGNAHLVANHKLYVHVDANTPLNPRTHTIVLHQPGSDAYLYMVINQESAIQEAYFVLSQGSYVGAANTLSFNIALKSGTPPEEVMPAEELELRITCTVQGSGEVKTSQIFPYRGSGMKEIEIIFNTQPQAMGSINVEISYINPSSDEEYTYSAGEGLNIPIN